MSDLTANRQPNRLGPPDACLIARPVGPAGSNPPAAAIKIYAGALCGYDSSGNVNNIDSGTCVTVAGVSEAYHDGTASAPAGATLSNIPLVKGAISFLNDGSITASTPYGTDLYAADNQTLSTSDSNGTRLRAGFFEGLDPSNTANVICQVGQASPLATGVAGGAFSSTPFYARVVCTLPDAYTGSGTATLTETTAASGLGTQEGVTLAVGDVVFVPPGSANLSNAKDSGPWVVSVIGNGATKWVLTRPDWWLNGSTIPQGKIIDIGGEGNFSGGSRWKTFCGKNQNVGTNDPQFFVGRITFQVTLASGTKALTAGTGGVGGGNCPVGILSASRSQCEVSLNTLGGTNTGTVSYGSKALTPGYIGTAAVSLFAFAANMTTQASDASVLNVTLDNGF